MRRLCACWLLALGVGPLWAHKYHASLTEMRYNGETRGLEIVLRLFADDLEAAIAGGGKRIPLDGPDAEAAVVVYLAKTFRLSGAGERSLPLTWVGMELEVDVAWVYLEIPLAEGLAGLSLSNRLFFDLFGDQVNRVNLEVGKRVRTLIFRPGDTFKPLPVDDGTSSDR